MKAYKDRMEVKRQLAKRYAFSFLGIPYSWGGDDPSEGFDCSGLIVEVLKGVGLLPLWIDLTADGLYRRFQDRKVESPYCGCLAFVFKGNRAIHVEFCIDEYHTIGASGGGRFVKTRADAIKYNAFVKLRPIRTGMVFVDPFLEWDYERPFPHENVTKNELPGRLRG